MAETVTIKVVNNGSPVVGAFVYPGMATEVKLITDINGEVTWDTDSHGAALTGQYAVSICIVVWHGGQVRASSGPMLVRVDETYVIDIGSTAP